MNFNFTGDSFEGMFGLFALWTLAWAIVHVGFAIGVGSNASARVSGGGRTELVPPFVWVLATLVGGVFVACAYWLVHVSMFSPVRAPDSASGHVDA